MKCDRIVGEGTCNSEHSDPSGLCHAHRSSTGETLRSLRERVAELEAVLVAVDRWAGKRPVARHP